MLCVYVRKNTSELDEDLERDIDDGLAQLYLPVHVEPDTPCGQALINMSHSLTDNSTSWAARSKCEHRCVCSVINVTIEICYS